MTKDQLRISAPIEMQIIKKALAQFITRENNKYPMKLQMRSIYLYQKVDGLIHNKPSSK